METLVYVDSGVVTFHGTDIIVNYIMAMMNIVRWQCDIVALVFSMDTQ